MYGRGQVVLEDHIMMSRWVLALALAVGLTGSTAGQALSPEASLKATHDTLMQAVTAANADRVAPLIHPRALGFFRDSQQVTELKGASNLGPIVAALLRDLGEFTAAQANSTTLLVEGNTGIVTQTSRRETVVEKKPVSRYLRTTGVYLRSGDGWKLLSWHTSDTPLVLPKSK